MANYSLVVNSKFQPMSLERMLYPLQEYSKAYKEQEDALAELDAKSSIWEGMLDKTLDPELYSQYQNYANSIMEQRDAIAERGLDVNSRRAMLNLRTRYAKDITPIEQAYNARLEDIKTQRDAYVKSGGKTRFSQNASTSALSNYLYGKRPEYVTANLDDVYKESAAGAQAISKRFFSTEEGKMFGEQYLDLVQRQGYSAKDAADILSNPDKYPEFASFMQAMRNRSGYSQFSQADQEAIDASILQGFNTGITYAEDHKPLQNGEYLSKAEKFSQTMQLRQLRMNEAENGLTYNADTKSYEYDPDKDITLKRKTAIDNTIPLTDGSTATPIKGGGGKWKVTHPDGTTEIKDSKDISGATTGINNPLAADFKKLDYTGGKFGGNLSSSGWSDHFSESDSELVSSGDLTSEQRKTIMTDLASYGLSLSDVDIYKDHDYLSNWHWRVVAKGAAKDGTRTSEEKDAPASKPVKPEDY